MLIAATVKDMYLDGWIKDLNFSVDDFDSWFEELAVRVHRRSADVIGAAFWDIHSPRTHTSEILSEVDTLRRDFRLQGMGVMASLVWQKAGGTGDPPKDLVMAFGLNMSAFATQALLADYEQTPEEIGLLTAGILKALVSEAVRAQRAEPADRHEEITASGASISVAN
jgi:hypothetical protein